MNGLLGVFRDELRRIFTVKPAFSVLVLGAIFYAFFYPQPYLNEALRDVPIAVVDRVIAGAAAHGQRVRLHAVVQHQPALPGMTQLPTPLRSVSSSRSTPRNSGGVGPR